MNREMAIRSIISSISDGAILVSTTGLISREIFEKYDYAGSFYIPGSMGLVSSVGLGLALNQDRWVVIVDGDSSLLMNFGSLVTCAKWQPTNLTHIVLDNGAYASCSEEKSMSETANFVNIAKALNYPKIFAVSDENTLKSAIIKSAGELCFIHAKIELGGRRDFERPLDLEQIKQRFMRYLKGDDRRDV